MPDIILYLIMGGLLIDMLTELKTDPRRSMICGLSLILLIVWVCVSMFDFKPAVLDATTTVHVVENCPLAVFDSESTPIMVHKVTNTLAEDGDTIERWDRKTNWCWGIYNCLNNYPKYKIVK